MEEVAAVAVLACGARFGLLLWHGYRYGQVKSAAPWSRYYDRLANPRIYWMFMVGHALVLSVCVFGVCYMALDLLQKRGS
jgi:hypothetical protein